MSRFQLLGKVVAGAIWKLRYSILPGRALISSGLLLLSKGARFQPDKGSKVSIGSRCALEYGTFVAVRNGGQMSIGDGVYINRNCTIVAREKIVFENGVTMGPNCCVYDHDHDVNKRGEFVSKPVIIRKNAWIGAGCIILKGVTIGENAVVAAGCVVVKDVPSNTILIQKRCSEYHKII